MPIRIPLWLPHQVINLRYDLWRQLIHHFQALNIPMNLFQPRRFRDDRGDIWVLKTPSQSQLRLRYLKRIRNQLQSLYLIDIPHPLFASILAPHKLRKAILALCNLAPSSGPLSASLCFPVNRPIFNGLNVVRPIPHRKYGR